jgi:hypothetical protein
LPSSKFDILSGIQFVRNKHGMSNITNAHPEAERPENEREKNNKNQKENKIQKKTHENSEMSKISFH